MAAVSKSEYLKRYLSADSEENKLKKKRKKKRDVGVVQPRIKIFDDDVDLKTIVPDPAQGPTSLEELDEAPTVAHFVDERPEHIKQLEAFRQSDKWKLSVQDKDLSKRHVHDSDSDSVGENGATRRKRHDSDSDQSPPRTKRHDSDSDQSLPRTKRHDSDSDQSPPRTKRHDSDSDQSPPRTKRHDSDSDQSPPRTKRHDSDSDQSPPRTKTTKRRDSDQSPPRKKTRDGSDLSPPRKKQRNSDSDSSSLRRKKRDSQSGNRNIDRKHSSRWAAEGESDDKTLSGKKAGLSSAKDMKRELELLKKKEDAAFRQIDDSVLGRNATTVIRDASGRKKNSREEMEKEREEAERMAKREEKYKEWGKGLKQQEVHHQNTEELLHEMSKPLARYEDDKDLDSLLREKERDGDPMAAFMRKKKSKESQGQVAKKKEFPVYKGREPPPNRFRIRPGYRWDGVDRSNGFEKKIFAQIAAKKARDQEAYKWSIEDM